MGFTNLNILAMAELKHLKPGDQGRVLGFQKGENKAYRHKLLSMGLTRGSVFKVLRYAPLGDPIEISILGFSLSLRKTEASSLLIEKVV